MARSVCIYVACFVAYVGFTISGAIPPVYPTTLTGNGNNRLGQADTDQLNDYINKYIFYFERRRQRSANDHVKQTMHVMKLLIVQSWITLEPEPGLFTLQQRKTLPDIKDSIQISLKKIDQSSSYKVKDYIIYYMDKIEPHIMKKLVSDKNSYKYLEKVFNDEEKVFSDKHDEKSLKLFQDTWNGILDVLDEIRSSMIIHKFSSRMILQSYIANFVPDRDVLDKQFTIISSDGTAHEYETPDSGLGIFNDITEITSEVDKDISTSDKIKNEVYYDILNERIRKYLDNFEKLTGKAVKYNDEMGKAMGIVRRLMIHGWIEALMPRQEFYPIKRSETLESNKNDIVNELAAANVNSPVSDAILLYADDKEQQIERDFKSKIDSLTKEYKQKTRVLTSKRDTPENKDEIYHIKEELKEIEKQINFENDNLVAHQICKLFYLNSYRENFIPEQQRKTVFRVEPSRYNRGKLSSQEFNVPSPIVVKDFFSDYITMDLD